jgi:hypothetical protein
MRGHLLRNFKFSSVLELRGDAGGAEVVAADLGLDAGGQRPGGSFARSGRVTGNPRWWPELISRFAPRNWDFTAIVANIIS